MFIVKDVRLYLDTGFAFSGEAGHALPITDPLFYEKQEIARINEQ